MTKNCFILQKLYNRTKENIFAILCRAEATHGADLRAVYGCFHRNQYVRIRFERQIYNEAITKTATTYL
jgi:hypothetical protein